MSAAAAPVKNTQAWWMAVRPRTLPVAVAPVVVGTAVAFAEGQARWLPALAALAGALLLQIVSNVANDLFDFERGADGDDRIGPPRAAQLGLLTPGELRAGIVASVLAAVGVGLYLVAVGGWPIAALGVVAIAAAITYTGGPWPFGYKGLGDPAVFVFFGVAAVTGTHYVQALAVSGTAVLASLPVGALATAILVVNNTRDIDSDRRAGKRTLAVRLGRRGARFEYGLLLFTPYAVLPVFVATGVASPIVLLPALTLPLAWRLFRVVSTETSGQALNPALAATAQLTLFFSLLFAVGLAWR